MLIYFCLLFVGIKGESQEECFILGHFNNPSSTIPRTPTHPTLPTQTNIPSSLTPFLCRSRHHFGPLYL